jgi:hypothetical protein
MIDVLFKDRRWSLLLASLPLLLANPLAAERSEVNTLFVGHSLINNEMPFMFSRLVEDAGLDGHYAAQIINGAPLRHNWEHRSKADFSGQWPPEHFAGDALARGVYDALVLTEAIPLQDQIEWNDSVLYAKRFVELAESHMPSVRAFLYETWHPANEGDWLQRIVNDRALWEGIVERVNRELGRESLYLIPAGQALRSLVMEIEGGLIPGYSSRGDIMADDIHMNDLGNYFIACVIYAAVYERSPVGRAYQLNNRWGVAYDAPSEALARRMQAIAWETVRGYTLSGLSPGD